MRRRVAYKVLAIEAARVRKLMLDVVYAQRFGRPIPRAEDSRHRVSTLERASLKIFPDLGLDTAVDGMINDTGEK